MSEYALEMLDVTKTFSKVTALNHVDLKVKEGEILPTGAGLRPAGYPAEPGAL